MEIDPATDEETMYRTISGLVVPRPIGWISTRSPAGIDNLAPYSFFNAVSVSPPVVMFSQGNRRGQLKDTASNAVETEEFVVNFVTHEFAERMNETSATLPPEKSEFEHAGLERAPSHEVDPPRVAGTAAAFECRLRDIRPVESNHLVLGDVVHIHVRDDITTNGKVDTEKLPIVGRLAGSGYDRVTNRFEMERPD